MSAGRTWRGAVFIATSLDGFIARDNGDIEWLTDPPGEADTGKGHVEKHAGPHPAPDYEAFIADVDHVVIGRGTLAKVLTFSSWPYAEHHVVVLSSTLPMGGDDRYTVTRSVEETAGLLSERGCSVAYVDGGGVIRSFLKAGLIDEMTISVAPVLLGSGLSLFTGLDLSADVRLTHTGTSTIGSGMTSSRYLIKHDS
ncbi:MAG: dihydrofolate reductase family protein [Ornithinimicrobium sp.]